MKKLSAFVALFLLGILLAGCPYESNVSINKNSLKSKPELLGKWMSDDGKMTLNLEKFDDTHYSIAVEEGKPSPDTYYGHLSDVNGTTFMNLSKTKPGSPGITYNYYKIELTNANTMVVAPITGNVKEKFSTPEEWGRFVADNMKNSYFFEEAGSFTRVGK